MVSDALEHRIRRIEGNLDKHKKETIDAALFEIDLLSKAYTKPLDSAKIDSLKGKTHIAGYWNKRYFQETDESEVLSETTAEELRNAGDAYFAALGKNHLEIEAYLGLLTVARELESSMTPISLNNLKGKIKNHIRENELDYHSALDISKEANDKYHIAKGLIYRICGKHESATESLEKAFKQP